MMYRLFIVALAAVLGSAASAQVIHDVSTAQEFRDALLAAQSNLDDDIINVAAGTYDIATVGTLTYTPGSTEDFSLFIYGEDSDLVMLYGAAAVPILQIDTTAVIGSPGLEITNMTFENGYAGGASTNGGALSIVMPESMMASITGSEFYNNVAVGDGGAIFISGYFMEGLSLSDLTIQGNSALGTDGGEGDGGGAKIATGNQTFVDLSDIDFFSNEAVRVGGGLDVQAYSARLYDIMFEENVTRGASGSGGGVSCLAIDCWVELVGFVNNTAPDVGGGLYLRDNSRMGIWNSGFVGNTARAGGGVYTDPAFFSGIVIEHATFTGNTATDEGGGAYLARGLPQRQIELYNNILWGNTGTLGADLYVDDDPNQTAGTEITEVGLFFNDIGNYTTRCTEAVDCTPDIVESDNISADPLLGGPEAVRLMAGSPCIDAGSNAGHPSYPAITVDFEGDTRPFDGDGNGVAISDMGVDEYTGPTVQEADLSITWDYAPRPATGGQDVTMTITVSNAGPDATAGATVIAYIDERATLDSAIFNQGTPCTSGGATSPFGTLIQCDLGPIAASNSVPGTIVIETPVVEIVTSLLVETNVMAEEDPDGQNNFDDGVITLLAAEGTDQADLAVTKIDTPDPVISGGPQLEYEITVTNNGPDAATGVTLTDSVPDGMTFVDATSTAGSCGINGVLVTCTIGTLAVDATATVTLAVTPEPVIDTVTIDNTATVAGSEEDPIPDNNSATATTTVTTPESDMMVTIVATPSSPSVGETVTYDITVMNDGPSHNLEVDMAITSPEAGTCQSAVIGQGVCGPMTDGVIDCAIGDMSSGATVTAEVVCTAPDEAASMVMSAAVSGSVTDPAVTNNAASANVTVIDAIEIVIQGKSEGSGAVGWLELLFGAFVVAAIRARRQLRFALPCLAIAALVLVPASQAVAQGQWYGHIAVGQADLDYDASDLTSDLSGLGWTITSPSVDSSDTTWKALAGFAFNENVAFEAGYVSLGDVTTQFGASIPPSEVDSLLSDTYSVHPYQGDGWVLAGVLSWPVDPDKKLSLTARAGFFAWESETEVRVIQGGTGSVSGDDSGNDAMYGIGVEWRINDTWTITAEWERYQLNEWLDVPSIGLKVYF